MSNGQGLVFASEIPHTSHESHHADTQRLEEVALLWVHEVPSLDTMHLHKEVAAHSAVPATASGGLGIVRSLSNDKLTSEVPLL